MTAIAAVIFDWAGTMIDFGCLAPVEALLAAFAAEGVEISAADARRDMGRAKRDHVRAILGYDSVAATWAGVHGRAPEEADGDRLYRALEPLMEAAAAAHAELVPGAAALAADLAARGIKVGSGTGYTRAMMRPILAAAERQGYRPSAVICAGETPSGRPSPLMMWQALIALDAWPAHRCVKVDDAEVGVAEGRAAGAWAVGVSASGNGVGLSAAAWSALAPEAREARAAASAACLTAAGAHYVVETVADLPPVLEAISDRIARDDRPAG
jgi:phosphonoacetaldehyde hydrolase